MVSGALDSGRKGRKRGREPEAEGREGYAVPAFAYCNRLHVSSMAYYIAIEVQVLLGGSVCDDV